MYTLCLIQGFLALNELDTCALYVHLEKALLSFEI